MTHEPHNPAPQHPSMDDILDAFDRLSVRAAESTSSTLEPFLSASFGRAREQLRLFIPGLDTPPDEDAARLLCRIAYASLEDNDHHKALITALSGLSFSPHAPRLWYAAAVAVFEYGEEKEAVELLRHVLWINPGHSAARADLEHLTAYLEEARIDKEEGEIL